MSEQPLFVSVEEAARRLGIGRTLAYDLCRPTCAAAQVVCLVFGWAGGCWCRCGRSRNLPWRAALPVVNVEHLLLRVHPGRGRPSGRPDMNHTLAPVVRTLAGARLAAAPTDDLDRQASLGRLLRARSGRRPRGLLRRRP